MKNVGTLPRTPDQITAEWLSGALGVTVAALNIDHIVWGTATKIFLNVSYAATTSLPTRLCVKGEFDERVRATLDTVSITGTQVEASFYRDLAPEIGVPLLNHWYAGSEPGQGVLILDDLRGSGVRFGDPSQAWRVDDVLKGLEVLAKLHAATWRREFSQPWLKVGSQAIRQYADVLFSERHWGAHFSSPGSTLLPASLNDRIRLLAAYRSLWEYDDAHAEYVVHGDAHPGNTCITADGHVLFIDWAGPCLAPWAHDVSYFVTGSLDVAERRKHERDLVFRYFEMLSAAKAVSMTFEDAWLDYKRHQLHGIIWSTLPATMQPAECVAAMTERFVASITDHSSLDLLGV